MSVKLMSPEQIRNDLKTMELTWPDGIPWEQFDRVNALKAELKRRGEPLDGPSGPPAGALYAGTAALAASTTAELEVELRKLSARDDEDSQKRFADVRDELRRRAKVDSAAPPTPPRSQVVSRELELPDEDDEIVRTTQKAEPKRPQTKGILNPTPKVRPSERELTKKVERPAKVRGYSAFPWPHGRVLVEYEVESNDAYYAMISQFLEPGEATRLGNALIEADRAAARLASELDDDD